MMRAEVDESGAVLIDGIDWLCVVFLARIPQLLVADDPAIATRLYPRPYEGDDDGDGTDDDNEQWRRLVHPDLKSLFASRADIVRGDLAGLATADGGETYRLAIPAAHIAAWEAALLGASHALYARHDLSPADVHGEVEDVGDSERNLALIGIEYQSRVLWMLLKVLDPDEPGFVADDDGVLDPDGEGEWDAGDIPPLDS